MQKTTLRLIRSAALLTTLSALSTLPCAIARGQASQSSMPVIENAPAQEPLDPGVTLQGEDLRRQNEINSRVVEIVHRVESCEDERDEVKAQAASSAAEAAAEHDRADKASERAALADAQAVDAKAQAGECEKALAAETRRGFWNRVKGALEAAPVALGTGVAVGVVVTAIVLGGGGG